MDLPTQTPGFPGTPSGHKGWSGGLADQDGHGDPADTDSDDATDGDFTDTSGNSSYGGDSWGGGDWGGGDDSSDDSGGDDGGYDGGDDGGDDEPIILDLDAARRMRVGIRRRKKKSDARWSSFRIVVSNADGTTSIKTLAEQGAVAGGQPKRRKKTFIQSINLAADETRIVLPDGSTITGQTTFARGNGRRRAGDQRTQRRRYDATGCAASQY
jgi:hypothetical protein